MCGNFHKLILFTNYKMIEILSKMIEILSKMIEILSKMIKNFFKFRDLTEDDSYPKCFRFKVAIISIITYGCLSIILSTMNYKYKPACVIVGIIMITSLCSDSNILEANFLTEIIKKIDVIMIGVLSLFFFFNVNIIIFIISFIIILYLYDWKKKINKITYDFNINMWHLSSTMIVLFGTLIDFHFFHSKPPCLF